MATSHNQTVEEQLVKRERLEARLSSYQKILLQRAADLQGRSLSDFVVESAQRAAEEIIREHGVVKLSAEDSQAFVEALLNPLVPTARMQAYVARYQVEVEER